MIRPCVAETRPAVASCTDWSWLSRQGQCRPRAPVGGLAHGRGQQFGVGRHEIGQRAGLQLGGPLYVDVEVAQPLAPAGFTRTQAKGDHEKWTLGGCHVVIPHARDISPGVVRQVLKVIGRSTS